MMLNKAYKTYQKEYFQMPVFDDDGCTFVATFAITTPIYTRGKITFSLPDDTSHLLNVINNLYELQSI